MNVVCVLDATDCEFYLNCMLIFSPIRTVNTLRLGNKNQLVYAVSGTTYKTHKYSVDRVYSC